MLKDFINFKKNNNIKVLLLLVGVWEVRLGGGGCWWGGVVGGAYLTQKFKN